MRRALTFTMLVAVLSALAGVAQAHPEPATGNPIDARVRVWNLEFAARTKSGDFTTGADHGWDGFDGNAEFRLDTKVVHVGHEQDGGRVLTSHEIRDWGDHGDVSWVINEEIYAHYEFGAGIGILVNLAAGTNGHDNWGTFEIDNVPENGDAKAIITGTNLSATVTYTGITEPVPPRGPGDCGVPGDDEDGDGSGEQTVKDYYGAIFPPLQEALLSVPRVRAEPGTGLDAADMRAARLSLASAVTGFAEVVAGLEIDAARSIAGIEEGVALFAAARAQAAESPAAALEGYGAAFLAAADAEATNARRDGEVALPLQIALTQDFFATRVGKRLKALAVVLGTSGPVELRLTGIPRGSRARVVPLVEGGAVSEIVLDVGRTRPGTYEIGLEVLDEVGTMSWHAWSQSLRQASRPLTLVVDSIPMCGGRKANVVGTARNETLRGSPGPDVIDGRGGNDRIDGRGGSDVICGGSGNDRLVGGGGNDVLIGGAGGDILDGQAGNDRLEGGRGRDVLIGGTGTDRCTGGPAVDAIVARTSRRCETIRP